MNILEFLKKGSGIHIKKKNRGKFTSYCGGKVTDECIRKAKASGNPTLVKRATFAANARKWKHQQGGLIQKILNGNPIYNSINKRRLAQANRLNSSNGVGNLAFQASKVFGLKMSEDSANDATIKYSSETALKDSKDYYNSDEYKRRLDNAKLSISNRDNLLKRLENVPIYSISDKSSKEFTTNAPGNKFRAVTVVKPFKGKFNGNRYNPGVYYNRSTMKNGNGENVYGTFIHEFSHWADERLSEDAKKYNHSLIEGNLNPNSGKYLGSDTEIRARAMDGIVTYEQNKDKYKDLDDFLEKEKDMKGLRELRRTFKDDASYKNYMHNFVSNNNPLFNINNVYYAKKGGKAFVEGVNVLDSNPNAYKYVKKKIKKNLLGGNVYSGLISTGLNVGLDIYSAYKKKEAANELGKALDKSTEVSQLELYTKYFLEEMEKLNNETLPDGIHSSNAFKSYVAHQRANKRALADVQKLKSLNELEKTLLLSLANQQVTSSIINGVSSLGLMLLNTKFSSKVNTNGAPSTTTPTTSIK